jgi:hypothetical protein
MSNERPRWVTAEWIPPLAHWIGSFVPLAAALLGSYLWFNWTCEPNQLNAVRAFLLQVAETTDGRLSQAASLRVTTASHIALGVDFALLAAGVGVILLSLFIIFVKSRLPGMLKLWAVVLALVIAVANVAHHRTDSCLYNWYFVWWYPPLYDLLPSFDLLGDMLVRTTNLAIGFLIAAIASLYYQPLTEPRAPARVLRDRFKEFRNLLYSAAILFTLAELAFLFSLYINVAPINPDKRSPFLEVLVNLTVIYGITFSIVLLAAFYPCLTQLTARAYALAGQEGPANSNPKRFFKQHGLDVSPYAHLKELAAVLSPVFAGSITAILKFYSA